jgi:hypothetical protein
MGFNLIDAAAAAYVGLATWRGRRRGLAYELPRTLKVLVLALTGAGLWHWTGAALGEVARATRLRLGAVGGVGAVTAAFFLVQHFKAQIRAWAARRFSESGLQRRGGALLGGLHALVLSSFLIVFTGLLPLGPLKAPFARGSFIGRNLIRFVVPVYANLSGQSHR